MLSTSTGRRGDSECNCLSTSRPLLFGIVKSSNTTSHGSLWITFSASCPSPASAVTAIPGFSAMIRFKPSRTTAWSSTTHTLIIESGNSYVEPGSLVRFGKYVEFTADPGNTLFHSDNSERFQIRDLRVRDALSIVRNRNHQCMLLRFQCDSDFRRLRMANHIRQRFLHDAKRGGRCFLRESGVVSIRYHLSSDSGA